jgi:hypothetical protein
VLHGLLQKAKRNCSLVLPMSGNLYTRRVFLALFFTWTVCGCVLWAESK